MGFSYKIVSSMDKVLSSGAKLLELEEKKLTGLKGEIVSFQIAYYWDENIKKFGSVEVISPNQDFVHVREVKLVPCEYPCHMEQDEGYLATEPGMYPDLLSEIGEYGFMLISGHWKSLWIDVEIPEDIEAGSYPLKVELKTKDEAL